MAGPDASHTNGTRSTQGVKLTGTRTTPGAGGTDGATPRRRRTVGVLWRSATPRRRPTVGVLWRAFGVIVVALRYPIVLGWIVAAVAATVYMPGIVSSGAISNLIPHGAPALRAEYDAARLFGLPLTSEVAVVQRDRHGFSVQNQMTAARRAVAIDDRSTRISDVAGALPVANTGKSFPGSRERSTTILTFLYFRPGTSVAVEAARGQEYTREYVNSPQDHLVGVTGAAPAEDAQGSLILGYLPWVELATVLAIGLIVGLHFRSVGAPLATLLCACVAFLIAIRVVAWAGQRTGIAIPPDLEPVLVVLLLGVTTDYSVFFLAGMRTHLAEGLSRLRAARRTTAEFAPIIITAGLLVAAGTASLAAARLNPLRAFGPTLALTVLIAMLVAVTLTPALIAVFGSALYLPGPAWLRRALAARRRPWSGLLSLRGQGERSAAGAGSQEDVPYWEGARAGDYGQPGFQRRPGEGARAGDHGQPVFQQETVPGAGRTWRERAVRVATIRPLAFLLAAACVAGLLIASLGLTHIRLGFPLIRALPPTSQAARAETAASKGFVPGILSPTEILVTGPGVTSQRQALGRLQRALAHQPGVAGIVGPADLQVVQAQNLQAQNPQAAQGQNAQRAQAQSARLMLARSGNAARFGLIERTDPLGATAINRVRALRGKLPALAKSAGLTGVRFEVGGETALSGEAIDQTLGDVGRIALVSGLVIIILLGLFLRAVIAPLYLLAASVLALLSALGLTVWVFQGLLHYDSLVYYVPFVVAVLMVSLGSDYNVFVVGRIWEEAKRQPLREAVATAVPRASRAITTAGLALAAGFALLALVPLEQFRELALAMVIGIVIDTFIVRSMLVPSLVVLFGRAGRWPGGAKVP